MKKNPQRVYDAGEWALAEVHSAIEREYLDRRGEGKPAFDLREAQEWAEEHQTREQYEFARNRDRFTLEANRVVTKWISKHPDFSTDPYGEELSAMGDDRIAWLTWATMQGHGVGFWEHVAEPDYASLKAAIDGDKKLKKAHDDLQNSIFLLAHDAPASTLEENPRACNPDRAREAYLLRGTR